MYSLIITDYRTMNQTISYIKRFLQNCTDNADVIIVDNSAREDGRAYLDSRNILYQITSFHGKSVYHFQVCEREVSLIDASENGGYSKGNNLGAAYSDETYNNPYYIFSNNDIEFPKQFSLTTFSELFDRKVNIGIIGPDIISPDGGRQNPRKMMGFISQMLLQPYNMLWFGCRFNKWLWNLDCGYRGECGWVSGSFMVVFRDAFRKVGAFDENIFLYGEEMILSEKMRRIGMITFYEPKVSVIHHHQGAMSNYSSRKQNHISVRYYYWKYRGIHEAALKISDICFESAEAVYKMKKRILG